MQAKRAQSSNDSFQSNTWHQEKLPLDKIAASFCLLMAAFDQRPQLFLQWSWSENLEQTVADETSNEAGSCFKILLSSF